MELADKLLLLRKKKGWTQAIASKNIDIQQSYLSKLESGRYQPSKEVIEKLCVAYSIKKSELITHPKKAHQKDSYLLLISFIGLILIIIGYFSLIFPQTYYTYKTQPLIQTQINGFPEEQLNLDYHLTDRYQGDKYIDVFSGIKYEYTLVSEREISRVENRWLIVVGLILFLLPISLYLFFLLKNFDESAA